MARPELARVYGKQYHQSASSSISLVVAIHTDKLLLFYCSLLHEHWPTVAPMYE
jgi:hypothetical protein